VKGSWDAVSRAGVERPREPAAPPQPQIVGPPLYAGVFARFSGPDAPTQIPAMPLLVAAGFAVVAALLFLAGSRRLTASVPSDGEPLPSRG